VLQCTKLLVWHGNQHPAQPVLGRLRCTDTLDWADLAVRTSACILLQVERLKPAYLAHRRAQGIYTDPFERARRQEQLQHQQQRPAPAAAAQQHAALPAAAAGALPALPAPPSGNRHGGLATVYACTRLSTSSRSQCNLQLQLQHLQAHGSVFVAAYHSQPLHPRDVHEVMASVLQMKELHVMPEG
jgi:hypothetical protein